MTKSLSLTTLALTVILALPTKATAFYSTCDEPQEPDCVDSLGLISEEYFFRSCRDELEYYLDDVDRYVECRINEVQNEQTELRGRASDYIDRFNCYARGNSIC